MLTQSFEDFLQVLDGVQTVAVCGHVHPDGDCIGSALALTRALRMLGKDVTPLLAEDKPAPQLYSFLPGYGDFITAASADDGYDLLFTVDTPNTERIGDAARLVDSSKKVLCIDHHPDTVDFADYCLSDPSAASVSMLVWDLIGELGVEKDADIASCCYVALVTDTGRFQFQNTTPEALAYASQFCAAGAIPSDIARDVYQSRTYASMQLEARLVDRIAFTKDKLLAYSWVEQKDFEELNAKKDDAESLPDVLRSLDGVEVSMVLRCEDGAVRGSMRAKNDFDVSAIAHKLDGGGHKAAAGFTVNGNLEDALAAVLPLFEEE